MQGVIKNLIIIHLGSMREHIHPNRWINSERGAESAGGGQSAGHHLSAFADCSGLYCRKAARPRQEWHSLAVGLPPSGLVSLSELREQHAFCLFGCICSLRSGLGVGAQHGCNLAIWSWLCIWAPPSSFLSCANLHFPSYFPFSSTSS